MALNIKNEDVERLAGEVAELLGTSKTRAVGEALEQLRERELLKQRRNRRSLTEFLETEVWPLLPPEELGKPPMTKEEREEILGLGPDGV